MKRTAKTLLLTAAILSLAGADGPKDAKTPDAEERTEAVESPSPLMSREEAIRRLEAAGYRVKKAAPWPGVMVNGMGAKWSEGTKPIALLERIPDVLILWLPAPMIEDSDLKHLQGLKDLMELRVESSKIKGEGLKYLKDMKKLRVLNIAGTDIGDEGLKTIAGMTGLEKLFLGRKVTERRPCGAQAAQNTKDFEPCRRDRRRGAGANPRF